MQRALPLTPVLIAALAMPTRADQYEVLYRPPGEAQDRSITITTTTGSYNQYKTLLEKQKWWNNYDYATSVLKGKLISGPDSGEEFYFTPSGANKAFATSFTSFQSTNELVERVNAQRSQATYSTPTITLYSIFDISERINDTLTWAVETTPIPISPIISSGNINTGDGNNKSSNLGKTLAPEFKGGILTIDETDPTYSLDFTVDNSNTNEIDSAGNTATFNGTFTDAANGIPGNLLIADSGSTGGIIRLNGSSTYSGLTTVRSGTL
jgi:autotransporter-associated beta strand protein